MKIHGEIDVKWRSSEGSWSTSRNKMQSSVGVGGLRNRDRSVALTNGLCGSGSGSGFERYCWRV